MKRIMPPTTLVVVLATLFVIGNTSRAQAGEPAECSNASLRGSFGFTNTGTNLAVPPPFAGAIAQIGLQTFDGRGNTHAAATLSANGNIVRATAEGSYVVNPDCTGSLTLFVSPFGSTVNADFVIDDDGSELRAVITDVGAVESLVFRSSFQAVARNSRRSTDVMKRASEPAVREPRTVTTGRTPSSLAPESDCRRQRLSTA